MTLTQKELVKEFFTENPNRSIRHAEAVDWLTEEYTKRTGEVFRDPDRMIRKLYQEGFLIKIDKGVYKYDPEYKGESKLNEFPPEIKKQALERDGYKCVVCGAGRKEGVELHVDHIKPQEKGGTSALRNAQVLCSRHNFLKKNLKQTEAGKKMFIRLFEKAKEEKNSELAMFCIDILKTYDEHDIDRHIEWTE